MRVVLVFGLLALGACQEQRTVVVEQTQAGGAPMAPAQPVRRPPPPSPCSAPWGTGPFEATPRPVHSVEPVLAASVHDDHVSGCAGVKFRIGPDGTARDITLVTEYPLGYGFGTAFVQALPLFQWTPRDDLAWHFIIYTHRESR